MSDRRPLGVLSSNISYLPAKLRYKANAVYTLSPLCSPLPSSSCSSSSPVSGSKTNTTPFSSSSSRASSPVPYASHTLNIQDITSTTGERIHIASGERVYIGRKLDKLSRTHQEHTRLVRLPKAAKHASRIHCCAQLSRDGEDSHNLSLKVEIIGQNGMLVQGAKKEKGEACITVGEGEHVVLGFYSGYELTVVCSAEAQEPRNNKREHHAISAHPTSEVTMPLSSDFTPMEDLLSDEGEEEEEEEEELVRPPTKRLRVTDSLSSVRSRSSSAAPSPYSHQEDDGYPPSDSSDDEGMDQDSDAKKAEELQALQKRVRQAVSEHKLDITGYLASGLVFQPRATLTTSECISCLLETQPSLLSHVASSDPEVWRSIVLKHLNSGPFGSILNDGPVKLKDAAGKILETSWYYSPALDKEDHERRKNLEPFVKSVRNAARHRAQYYFKPIQDLKKRKW